MTTKSLKIYIFIVLLFLTPTIYSLNANFGIKDNRCHLDLSESALTYLPYPTAPQYLPIALAGYTHIDNQPPGTYTFNIYKGFGPIYATITFTYACSTTTPATGGLCPQDHVMVSNINITGGPAGVYVGNGTVIMPIFSPSSRC